MQNLDPSPAPYGLFLHRSHVLHDLYLLPPVLVAHLVAVLFALLTLARGLFYAVWFRQWSWLQLQSVSSSLVRLPVARQPPIIVGI
jgi:hypothetical protein